MMMMERCAFSCSRWCWWSALVLVLVLLAAEGGQQDSSAAPPHPPPGPPHPPPPGPPPHHPGPAPHPAPPHPAPPPPHPAHHPPPPAPAPSRCQEISVPLCRGVGYNHTSMPNRFHHATQDEAGLEAHQFWPLVEIRCSADLRLLLCGLYTPICLEEYRRPLPPCRALCERARRGCAPLMRQYGFPWPERMRCELLPARGDPDTLCMDRDQSTGMTTTAVPPLAKPTPRPVKPYNPRKKSGYGTRGVSAGSGSSSAAASCEPGCRCRPPLVPLSRSSALYGRVRTGRVAGCAAPCHSPYFGAAERGFTVFWLGLWSALCFLSSAAAVATFLLDTERFRYPERPVIFLSACHVLVSAGYLVRLVAGHERVACTAAGTAAVEGAGLEQQQQHVHYESSGPALCTVVFLLVYFFGMASCIWWVVLSLTWFLAAGLKWGHEAIAGYAPYFHVAAWLLPSIKCVAALALGSVDGDPVAGICYVGNQRLDTLRGFVLAPLVVYLLAGSAFLLAGFVSLFRIRAVIKRQAAAAVVKRQAGGGGGGGGTTEADKLERLMLRLGAFTVLYTVPAAVIVACYVYEQHNRPAWEEALSCACPAERERGARPDYAVFMLKYFTCLLVGITSGAWVWSGKTLESWRVFCTRCCWGGKAATAGSAYSDVSTGLTWRSGTASSVSCPPKQTPLSRV